MVIVNQIKKDVKKLCDEYKKEATDNYDFWNEHIKYVYREAGVLAKRYDADEQIVLLGALLHDIALIKRVGKRDNHHVNGFKIAIKMLSKYNYPQEKALRVANCVLHHRSSKDALNIEEICVCDADIISHFDNIPMIFDYAYKEKNVNVNNVRCWIKKYFEDDFNDLSSQTKKYYSKKYKAICDVLFR